MDNIVSLLITVFCLTIYTSSCAADSQDRNAYVTEYKNINDGSGNYEFRQRDSNAYVTEYKNINDGSGNYEFRQRDSQDRNAYVTEYKNINDGSGNYEFRQRDSNAYVTEYKNINDGSGNYEFSYITSNGQKRRETGLVMNPGRPDQYIAVYGMFCIKATSPCVFYKADLNGYRIDNMVAFGQSYSPQSYSSGGSSYSYSPRIKEDDLFQSHFR